MVFRLPGRPCRPGPAQKAAARGRETTERMPSKAVNAVRRFLRPACSKPRFPVVSLTVVCSVFGVFHGPPRQLERLFAPFAGDLPGRFVSGNLGYRKSLF